MYCLGDEGDGIKKVKKKKRTKRLEDMVSDFKELESSIGSWNVTSETTKHNTFRVE